jgi:hypothetical protein
MATTDGSKSTIDDVLVVGFGAVGVICQSISSSNEGLDNHTRVLHLQML